MKIEKMKIAFHLFILVTVFVGKLSAQTNCSLGDDWIEKNKGLSIGDTMPNLLLIETMNNPNNINSIRDLKGKVIILDFWTTTCSSCIAFFPKLEKMQAQFGNKIQIILVNVSENKGLIDKRFKERYAKNINLPNLLSVFAASEFGKLFPTRYVPHHVIIDKEGVIRVIGPPYNTYEQKIEKIVNGQKVTYLNGENTKPKFNEHVSYHSVLQKEIISNEVSSVLTLFNNDYAPLSGGVINNLYDSHTATIRNTWVNRPIWEVYVGCFPEALTKYSKQVIYSSFDKLRYFEGIDTSLLTDEYYSRKASDFNLTDTTFMNTRICYEQVGPHKSDQKMLDSLKLLDLNSFFNKKLNLNVTLTKKLISCWVLRKVSDDYKLLEKNNTNLLCEEYEVSGVKYVRYRSFMLREAIRDALPDKLKNVNEKVHVIDESGYAEKKVSIELPVKFRDINEMNLWLAKYGLRMYEELKSVEMIVFSKLNKNK